MSTDYFDKGVRSSTGKGTARQPRDYWAEPSATPQDGGQAPAQDNSRTRVKNGGGFNPSVNPTLNINMSKAAGQEPGEAAAGAKRGSTDTPGSDFMSNEDIRAFCEHIRKESRNDATLRAMDADHLEAVLRTIPDLGGSLGGSRARARRVSKWLKKIAAADKAKQKYAAALYATFEREFDAELRQIGKGRVQQRNVRAPFGWS